MLALALSGSLAGSASAAQDDLDFVSRATDGAGGTSLSVLASISADGRYVAFVSDANNLSTEDDDSIANVYVRDVQTNTTTLVSRASGVAGAGGDAQSLSPSISGDGRYVVFGSDANNLSTEDNDAIRNIFVRDLQANTTTLVSRASGVAGAVADQGSFELAISGDGHHVVFESFATNLSTANNDAVRNIYVRDLQASTTTFVSRADGAAGAAGGADSFHPVISSDGRHVAFGSNAANLSDANDDGWSNVYVRDLVMNTTTFVSRATGAAGAGSTTTSADPTISGDGRYVAFNAQVNNNLSDQDNDAVINVYLRDLLMNTTTFVSRATGPAGTGGNGDSYSQAISADGRYVAFVSLATNLSDADEDTADDIFVRDLQIGTTKFVSRASGAAGAGGNGDSAFPAISADGRHVAFESGSTNLSDQDVDAVTDVFRRDVLGPTLDTTPPDTVIDTGPSGPTADATPDFTFHSTESGSTFKCRIDAGAFGACNGGSFTSAPLADGAHTFEVKATDPATNEDPTPASRGFTLDTTAPPPGPGPGPDPAPPDPTPPDPDAPRVTKMTTAEQLVAGRPGVLKADLSGSVKSLDWDLDGDGTTDVSCPGDQTTLRFRLPATKAPLRKAAFSGQITARAVSHTGTASPFTQTFSVEPSPTAAKKLPAPVEKIANFIERKPPVYACGREADLEQATAELTGNRSDPLELKQVTSRWPCTDKRLTYGPKPYGSLLITGCFKAIRTIEQVPEADRGSLNPVLDVADLPKFGANSGGESNAIKTIDAGLDFTEAYISEGPVLVNGMRVEPQGAGGIIVFPQFDRVYSSNAAVSVGGIKLEHPPKFSLNFGYGAASPGSAITWETFKRAPGGLRAIGGFPLTGDVRVILKPGTASAPPGARIETQLQLPNSLSFLPLLTGQKPPGKVKIEVTEKGELVPEDLTIGPIDASLGVASIADLTIKFVGGTEWRGTGKLCVLEDVCLSAEEIPGDVPPGGVIFRDGELRYLFLTLGFDPGITLYPGIQLNRIGAGFELNPTTFLGSARFTAMEIFEIDGKVAMAFPSTAAPYKLTEQKMGPAFAGNLYRNYTTFTLALAADAYLKLPIIDERIRLGGGYLLYNAPGYVAFGGGMDYDFLGILQVRGTTQGEFNFANGRFNLRGEVELCVVDIICRGSNVIVSSVGVGGCVNIDLWIGDINIGGGVRYDPFEVILWPFDGCKWSRFHDPNVFGGAQAGAAGRPHNVQIKAGDPGRAVRLEGADGAPRVQVTAPDGQVHESPQEPGVGGTSAIRFLRSEELKATVVGLQDPKPGKYTIEALPGSPAITKVTEAEDPPDAQISADVRDVGASSVSRGGVRAAAVSSGRRTIRYNIRRRPDQLVTFVEVGPEGSRPIGTATGGRGTLSFTPAPGRGKRRVEAQFELAGIRAETLTVATFTPPSPRLGRPARVRVSRRGTSLRVSWPRVAGATGYDVVTTLASGDQRRTRTRRNSITIARVIRSTGGTVAVRPTATLREGAARSTRFRATARHTLKRFEPLLRFGRK